MNSEKNSLFYRRLRRIPFHATKIPFYASNGLSDITNIIRGTTFRNRIDAFWYRKHPNFGDLLTPLLLSKFGFSPVYKPPHEAQVASVGSILQRFPTDYTGLILGSGLILEEKKEFPNAQILAVRGKLTRDLIRAPKKTPLGDPGLLVNHLVASPSEKKNVLGFVPHFVDKLDTRLRNIQHRYPTEVKIIDVERHPIKVLKDIAECSFILSSSLHGLIAADAYQIPNAWMVLSDKVKGNGFKFHDYYSGSASERHPVYLTGSESLSELIKLTHSPSPCVQEQQECLYSIFQNLHNYL